MACRRSSVRPRYAPPDLTEKAKRIRASPFLLNLPRRSSGAAPARHPTERSRAPKPRFSSPVESVETHPRFAFSVKSATA